MTTRLTPGEHIFCVAELAPPVNFLDQRIGEPEDLWAPDSKWFFVETIAITSGGGRTPDPYAPGGMHHNGIGTSVRALWAKAKSDIPDSARPLAAGDRVRALQHVLDPNLIRPSVVESWDGPDRVVERVTDTARGQWVHLEPLDGCSRLNDDGPSSHFKKCEP